jgi:GNAT superfamily N-acetyltransferase
MDKISSTYTDKQNRVIDIDSNEQDAVAEHKNIEIGRFVYDDNGKMFLAHMDISDGYQRCGIGVELIKLGEEWYDDFNIIDHLADEGAAFLNYCLNNQIFKHNHEKTHDDRY